MQGVDYSKLSLSELGYVSMADIKMKPRQWLIPGRVPVGDLTIIAGSYLGWRRAVAATIAASVATGAARLGWPAPDRARRVLYAADASDWMDDVSPLLSAAGADLGTVDLMGDCVSLKNIDHWRRRIVEASPGLLVIDRIESYLSGTSLYPSPSLYRRLSPLVEMSRELGFGVLATAELSRFRAASFPFSAAAYLIEMPVWGCYQLSTIKNKHAAEPPLVRLQEDELEGLDCYGESRPTIRLTPIEDAASAT